MTTAPIPRSDFLATFLLNLCFAYETSITAELSQKNINLAACSSANIILKKLHNDSKSKAFAKSAFVTKTKIVKCILCSENHFLNQCKVFASKSRSERFDFVKNNKLYIRTKLCTPAM